MAANGTSNGWIQIRQGVAEVEKLIGKKQYNLSMIRARQTLEYMVEALLPGRDTAGADLNDKIELLYKNKLISLNTRDHYHKIRTIGNKAVQEGDNNAYNATTAYHLLSQEVYTFANSYAPEKKTRTAAKSTGARKKKRRMRIGDVVLPFSSDTLFKALVAILTVILLIVLVRLVVNRGDSKKKEETTPAVTTIAPMPTSAAPVPATPAPTTEAETMAPAVYKTSTDSVRVRSTPSKDNDNNIIGVLENGAVVEYVSDVDDFWAKITYDGKDAYIAKQFIVEQ